MHRFRHRSLLIRSRIRKGTDLTGTNTLFEGTDVHPVKEGDIYDVAFTQKMTLQGGEYLLSMSCTGFEGGEHVVYHRLYDVAILPLFPIKTRSVSTTWSRM